MRSSASRGRILLGAALVVCQPAGAATGISSIGFAYVYFLVLVVGGGLGIAVTYWLYWLSKRKIVWLVLPIVVSGTVAISQLVFSSYLLYFL